jgi:hypothetical protein
VGRLGLRNQVHYDMVMTLFGRHMDINAPGRKYRGRLQRLSWKELLLLRLTVSVRTGAAECG